MLEDLRRGTSVNKDSKPNTLSLTIRRTIARQASGTTVACERPRPAETERAPRRSSSTIGNTARTNTVPAKALDVSLAFHFPTTSVVPDAIGEALDGIFVFIVSGLFWRIYESCMHACMHEDD